MYVVDSMHGRGASAEHDSCSCLTASTRETGRVLVSRGDGDGGFGWGVLVLRRSSEMRGRAIVGLTTACEALVGPALARAQVMRSPVVAPVCCRFDEGMRVVDAGCVGDSLGVALRSAAASQQNSQCSHISPEDNTSPD